MKKNVMKKAWEIAKEAVKKFGGKSVEYFSEALKIAWKEVKESAAPKYVEIKISEGSRKHKSYVAKVKGLHDRFGIDREFVSHDHDHLRVKVAIMFNGNIYEIQDAGDRKYVRIVNGQMVEMSYENVLLQFA